MKVLIQLFWLCFFCIPGIQGFTVFADTDVSVEISIPPKDIALGDSITLFCTVTGSDDVVIGEPELLDEPVYFDIERIKQESTPAGVSPPQNHYTYLLYVFSPDTLRVGPFIAPYTTAEGDTLLAVSNRITVLISGLVDNVQVPPQPNRNPLKIVAQGFPLWLIILLVIIIAVMIIIIVILIRRKKTTQEPIMDESIDELGEFERIRKLRLYESGQIKDLYILVSFALRGFIHRNMEFDALFETTGEIIKNLQRTYDDEILIGTIREILDESDKVKFAKYLPPDESAATLIDRASEPVKKVLDEIFQRRELEKERSEHDESVIVDTEESTSEITGGE